jgi:hypothetical protein
MCIKKGCKYMKTMTCEQLGGACDQKFDAESFDEMAKLSQEHGKEMFQKQDQPHLKAMEKMRGLMSKPNDMQDWFESKKKEFEEGVGYFV